MNRVDYLFFVLAICLLIASIGLAIYPPSVQAAPPAPPEVTACVPINTAGVLVISRCEPEDGLPYIINSAGFMLWED
jgi:hypothetical protein